VLIREYQTLWSFRAFGKSALNGMQMECKAAVLAAPAGSCRSAHTRGASKRPLVLHGAPAPFFSNSGQLTITVMDTSPVWATG
jgi:hypothetical protein